MTTAFIAETPQWADAVFCASPLPDERLHNRLIQYASAQAEMPTASTTAACCGNVAAREAAYRFLENPRVLPDDILEGVFMHTGELCKDRSLILAVQDTTSVAVRHRPLAQELQEQGSPTGFLVHTTLALDGETGEVIGILDQDRWIRDKDRPGKAKRNEIPYEEKESFKWEAAVGRTTGILESTESMVTVADREADIYELLEFHIRNNLRFVLRACWDRRVDEEAGRLWAHMQEASILGTRIVHVSQRGGQGASYGQKPRKARQARNAETEIRTSSVTILPPKNRTARSNEPLIVNAVLVTEPNPPAGEEPLEWLLFTSEDVSTLESTIRVIRHYELRWTIEDFHRCWKTGCRLEERPLQSLDAVERMMTILAPIAVRIMQLHALANGADEEMRCNRVLQSEEWKCLWQFDNPGKKLPSKPPSVRWALKAVARLGGWYDSKRTGRIGWVTLWRGWMKLQDRVAGWRAAINCE